ETIGSFQLMDTEVTNLMYKIYIVDALESGDITSVDNVEGPDGTLYFEMSNLDSKITVPQGLTNTFIIEEGFEDHPVNFVSYYGAEAYAEHYNLRLPTEWEWEIAARGGGGGGGIEEYPWGNDDPVDETVANYRNSGDMYDNGTTPAGYYPAYHSLYDMAGNVWEWTSSEGDLVNDDGESYKILRGGSWNSTLPYLKCWVRNFDGTKNYDPDETYSIIGFRCAQ
ncbi:MAG: SUMF1/EgtB/PvdO family nonheme iron enzyme, partial [Candidatus Zophobacter franzmannii]|nr:SUMF1/EgtB/PvdO family nonheme iron enzyme [Candidatus Zophobacter franzmannii]